MLAYRVVQLGIPAILGSVVFVQLRRTLMREEASAALCEPIDKPLPAFTLPRRRVNPTRSCVGFGAKLALARLVRSHVVGDDRPMETEKKRPRSKRGKCINWSSPNWEPILHLARIYADEFMWVVEIELRGGKRLQAYKNYWTRRYIHLDDEANAFVYRGDDLYRQVPEEELRELFDRVIRRPDPSLPIEPIGGRFVSADEWGDSEGSADTDDLPDVPF